MDETLTKYSQDIKNSLKSVDETEIKSVVGKELLDRSIESGIDM